MFLLTFSFLLSTLKQMAAAVAKLKSTRNRQSLNPEDVVNRRFAAKKQVEGMKKKAESSIASPSAGTKNSASKKRKGNKAKSSIASPSAGTKNSDSKKRKGAASSSSRKSARLASQSETGQVGKELGSLMEEAAESGNSGDDSDEEDDDDNEEDGGSKKKRSGKK